MENEKFDEDDGTGNKTIAKMVLAFVAASVIGTALFLAFVPKANAGDLSSEQLSPQFIEQAVVPSVQLGKFCSGTIIHSDRDRESGKVQTIILTAKHCTDAVDQKLVINIAEHNERGRVTSETSWNAIVTGQSYKSDIALIELTDTNKIFQNVAKVADKDTKLEFGQKVYTVSFPLGISKTYTEGNLGFVDDISPFGSQLNSQSGEFLRATPNIAGGSSGSGLFLKTDAGDYELIGTLTAGYTVGTFANLYTPLDELNEYLSVASKTWAKSDIKSPQEKKADEEKTKDFDKTNTWERAQ